ncbi:MAG: membrane protein insertion efficiency factor YidD [Bacillota bacterium]|nr:membrane protein insertion efficiency factor YidD [Bacillota bacterium]
MTGGEKISRALAAFAIGAIRVYQNTLSRVLPRHCRFYPTCSQYAVEAIARHGIWRGGSLAARRILRCHPGCPGGYDPVPEAEGRAKGETMWGC